MRSHHQFNSMNKMKRSLLIAFVLLSIVGGTSARQRCDGYQVQLSHHGVLTTISFLNDSIVHVTKTYDRDYRSDSLIVFPRLKSPSICSCEKRKQHLLITTRRVVVDCHLRTGLITLKRLNGQTLVSEQSTVFTPCKDGPFDAYTIKQAFTLSPTERIYGLGQVQNGLLNQRGQHIRLLNENMKICVPVFLSSKGYMLYWENYSPTDFDDDGRITSFTSTGKAADYYVIVGSNALSAQRALFDLTGHVPMPALWNLGVWQSKERYTSSSELLDALKRLRSLRVPVDGIVQDWQYWGDNLHWNAQQFLNPAFSDYQQMIDSIHALHAKLLVSVWPDYGPATEQYQHLQSLGKLLPGKSFPNDVESRVYDAFDSYARSYYWHHIYEGLLRHGVDALWLDSTEPDYAGSEADMDFVTGAGRTWRSLRNAFPLATVLGVYHHHRQTPSLAHKRVSILTRSAFAGMQRTGAFVWSGDIDASWQTLAHQIPAALNASISGFPLWNSDTGGFWVRNFEGGCQNPAYRRLFARWTQFSTFTPMLRFHGTNTPREIWNYGSEGDAEGTYDNILRYIRLRYRLLPWLYSQVHQLNTKGELLMGALPLYFPHDSQAAEIIDEYLFGQSFLVAPMLSDKADGRQVYLPSGNDWIDFWTGETLKGGQWLYKQAPYHVIPLYVRAGSIMPWGPDVQYATEKKWDDMEIRVYPGADGDFTLYEDAFDGYGYEQSQSSEIRFHWDDQAKQLTIGERNGAYPGMIQQRTFRVVVVTPEQPLADGRAMTGSQMVTYDGRRTTVDMSGKQAACRQMAANPFITHIYTADPSAHVWADGRLYVYASHDIYPARGCDLMDAYHVFSTDDMVHWIDHGEILRQSQVPWGRKEGGWMWAPDCAYKNGKYYFYFPHPSETETFHSWKIGVAVSDKPASGFKVVGYIKGAPSAIDPCVFVDDDGQAYIYNGGGTGPDCYGGKLKDNMVELDGEMSPMKGIVDFHEAPYVHKYNGWYYLTYADNYLENGVQRNRLRYCMSHSPLGPWEYKGVYLEPTDCDTSHGSVVEFKGQWYAFYHCCTLSHQGNLRSICADRLFYHDDGTIATVVQGKRETKRIK